MSESFFSEPFKKNIKIIEEYYNGLKAQLLHEKYLQPTGLYDNNEKIKKLEEEIAAYEYFFPFF